MLIRIYEDRDGPLSMRFPARGAGLSPFAMFGLCFELGRQACYDDKTGSLMADDDTDALPIIAPEHPLLPRRNPTDGTLIR